MPDYSTMSDADLLRLVQPPQATPSYSGMSDSDLMKLVGASAPTQDVMDRLAGTNGPRYQTWPERLVRGIGSSMASGLTLAGDVYQGKAQIPSSGAVPGSVPFGDVNSSGERVADLAGLVSPVNPAARAGDMAIPGMARVMNTPRIPTSEQLLTRGGAGFDAARESELAVPGGGMQRLASWLESQYQNKGIYPEHAPDAYATIKRIYDTPGDAPISLGEIHNIRQSFQSASANFSKPKDTLAGSMGVEAVDRLLGALAQKGAMVRGTASGEAGTAIGRYSPVEASAPEAQGLLDAIGNWGAGKRSDSVTGRENLAALRAQVSNSGQNLDNATRSRFVDIASEGRAANGFNEPEVAQALRVAQGAPATNTARFIGNLLGGGGGLGMAVTSGIGAGAGALLGGPVGAGIGATVGPIAGATSKAIANALTRREVGRMDEMVRMRSPLYEQWAANPGSIEGARSPTEALARLLMEGYAGTSDRNLPQNEPLRITVRPR